MARRPSDWPVTPLPDNTINYLSESEDPTRKQVGDPQSTASGTVIMKHEVWVAQRCTVVARRGFELWIYGMKGQSLSFFARSKSIVDN